MDETSYLHYIRLAGDGEAANRGINAPVELKLIDEPMFAHEGKMDFVDNAIDRGSGTIRTRAEFPNPNGILAPGMFRSHPGAGWVAERGTARAGRCYRHRAGSQICPRG
jgi:hypothetical protein